MSLQPVTLFASALANSPPPHTWPRNDEGQLKVPAVHAQLMLTVRPVHVPRQIAEISQFLFLHGYYFLVAGGLPSYYVGLTSEFRDVDYFVPIKFGTLQSEFVKLTNLLKANFIDFTIRKRYMDIPFMKVIKLLKDKRGIVDIVLVQFPSRCKNMIDFAKRCVATFELEVCKNVGFHIPHTQYLLCVRLAGPQIWYKIDILLCGGLDKLISGDYNVDFICKHLMNTIHFKQAYVSRYGIIPSTFNNYAITFINVSTLAARYRKYFLRCQVNRARHWYKLYQLDHSHGNAIAYLNTECNITFNDEEESMED